MVRLAELINKQEMAKKLGISVATLDRYRKDGLPSKWLGGVKFDPEEVEKWLEDYKQDK